MKDFILEHIKKTLGIPASLSSGKDEKNRSLPFHIGTIPNCPSEGATTLVTVGLSEKILKQEDGTGMRHELLLCTYDDFGKDVFSELMKVLGFIANGILESGEAIGDGDLIDLGAPILPDSRLSAIYLCDPIYFPEEFCSIENIDPPVTFAWAVPVTREEMLFAEEGGPEAMNDLFPTKIPI